MAKTKISDYSSTPNSNTDIDNININEGCSPSGINNAIRALMSHLKNWQDGSSGDTLPVSSGGTGASTASAARAALSAAASGVNSDITSLSGITTPLSVAQGGTGAALVSTSFVSRTSSIATITTSTNHTLSVNDVVNITGCTDTTFNTTAATVLSVPTLTTFTFSSSGDPTSGSPVDTTGKVLNLSYANLTKNVTGNLAINKGGTGNTSIAKNRLVVGNGTSALSTLAADTAGNTLISTAGSTVNAADLVEGVQYTILTVGSTTTNWTSIGAAAATVGTVFTKNSTPATGNGTATENIWTSGVYTPAKLSTASGSAPSYSARAFVRFNASLTTGDISGSYTHSGTSATVTVTAHGLSVGHRVFLNFTSGLATDALYTVTSVTDANTFVATGTYSGTTSGAVTLPKQDIVNGKNVAFVSRVSTSLFVVNFSTAMSTIYAPTFVSAVTTGSVYNTAGYIQDVNSVVITCTASSAIVNVVTFE